MGKFNAKSIKEAAKNTANKIGEFAETAIEKTGETASNAGAAIVKAKSVIVQKATEIKDGIPPVRFDDILRLVMKAPVVQVDRVKFLRKELIKYYPEDIVALAIEKNPAFAGIEKESINRIANQVITFETNKVTSISFASGLPGGATMFATIPADVTQYFTFILRTMQKLAYLYGFPAFTFSEDEVDDDTLNHLLVFMGVMFGVQGANQAVKALAKVASQKITKTLAQKALTKTTIYPIVKKVAILVGIRMTKQVYAENISKVVPVVGGIVSGGLTYATFRPGCVRLKNTFKELALSDPEFYKQQGNLSNEALDVEYIEIEDANIAD